jgi:hypothetical protein
LSFVSQPFNLSIGCLRREINTAISVRIFVVRGGYSHLKHNRSLKVAVQGLDFMTHPLYIFTFNVSRYLDSDICHSCDLQKMIIMGQAVYKESGRLFQ